MPPRRSPKSPDSSWHVPFLDALEKLTGQLAKMVDDPAAASTVAGASLLGGPAVAGAVIPLILILRFKAQWDKEKKGSEKSAALKKALDDQLRAARTMAKGNFKDIDKTIDRLIAADIPDTALPLLILFRDIGKNGGKLDGLGSALADASSSLKTIRNTLGNTEVRIGNLESRLLMEFRTSHEALVRNLRIETSNLPKALRPSFDKLEKSLAVPLDNILQLTTELATKQGIGPAARVLDREALLDYARQIDRDLDEPEILSVRRTMKDERISLSRLFVEPMLRQLVRPDPSALEMPSEEFFALQRELKRGRASKPAEAYELARASYHLHEPAPACPMIEEWKEGGILLFAGAGGGKSALLRVVALRWARGYLDESTRETAGPVPILVELRRYATARAKTYDLTLLKYIANANDCLARLPEAAVRAALAEGRARLFLDGLDEVPTGDTRRKILGEIHQLLDRGYPCLVTSRVFGFEPAKWCARSDTLGYHMLTLEAEQQKLFIRRAAEQMERGDDAIARIVQRVERRLDALPHAEEMAANPLLLTLILLVHATGAGVETRADLYKKASEMLIDAWEDQRLNDARPNPPQGVEVLQMETKISILRHLAWQRLTHPAKDGENLFIIEDVKQAIDAGGSSLLPQTRDYHKRHFPTELRERHYVLCSRGGEKVSFVHRTFLEYFAALHLAEVATDRTLDVAKIFARFIQPRLHDERWRETLRLYLSLALKTDLPHLHRLLLAAPVKAGDPYPLLLSAEAFLDTRQEARSADLAREIAEAAANYFAREDLPPTWGQGEAFGKRTPSEQLARALVRLDVFLGQPLERWRKRRSGESLDGHALYAAIPELARSLGQEDDLLEFLLSVAGDKKRSEWSRWSAVEALGWNFQPQHQIRELLRKIVLNAKENDFVRTGAIYALHIYYAPDGDLISGLGNIVNSQKSEAYLRTAATTVLFKWTKNSEE